MPSENWDDSEPSADPKIRAEYEAALGQFLVKFNRLENIISEVLRISFEKLDRSDLYKPNAQLSVKLHTLEILSLALPAMHRPKMGRINKILEERNKLAHGHFEQNPYSGEYQIVTRKAKLIDMPIHEVRRLAEQANEAAEDVRSCMIIHWFDSLPAGELPPAATT